MIRNVLLIGIAIVLLSSCSTNEDLAVYNLFPQAFEAVNITLDDGGFIDDNSSCLKLWSPNKQDRIEICDNNSIHFFADGVEAYIVNATDTVFKNTLSGNGSGLFDVPANASNGSWVANALSELNMNNFSIINIGALQASDGSQITFGAVGNLTGIDTAINFYNNQTLPGGAISHAITQENRLLRTFQVGLPSSAGYMRNSQIISQDWSITNGTVLSNCQFLVDEVNNLTNQSLQLRPDCSSNAFTGNGTGADLLIEDDLQAFGTVFVEEGIEIRNNFNYFGTDDNVIGFSESNLRIYQDWEQEFTNVVNGELFFESFDDGDIDPFSKVNQTGTDSRNWLTSTDNVGGSPAFIGSASARARGGDGGADKIMVTSLITLNVSSCSLSFYDAYDRTDAGEGLDVIFKDGSGYSETIYSNKGAGTQALTFRNISINNLSFYNQSSLDFYFIFSASNNNEYGYVDEVDINCDFSAGSFNVTKYDTIIKGINDDIYFRYNDSSDNPSIGHGTWQISHPLQLQDKHGDHPLIECVLSNEGSIMFNESNGHFYGCYDFEWRQLDN